MIHRFSRTNKVGLIKNPNITFFTSLLDKDYKSVFRVFHSSRSPHCLQNQWQLLYKYDLLQGQRIPHPSLSRHHDVAINNSEEKEPTVMSHHITDDVIHSDT
jgi:hypothetical protein